MHRALRYLRPLLLAVAGVFAGSAGMAAQTTVPVLMLSDIHLDPFHDPAKLAQLRSAPVEGWATILNAAASPTQAADFAHLQSMCGARGVDTPPVLFESSLAAERREQPRPLFVTVSGDLMAHDFPCRFHTLAPAATEADYSAFAAKTVAYIALRLRQTFARSPVYLALGNNDSGCADYREDPNSAFLQADAAAVADDAGSPANRDIIERDFSALGDYTIALPAPMRHARLIVLQDIFESKKFTACDGEAPLGNMTPAGIQTAWLREQLEAARAAHENVWVMAHIPPGIDAYSTFSRSRNVCAAGSPDKPVMFLSSEDLAGTLADFPGTIRLALFGHTHMDEFRLYTSPSGETVPGKLVPSITPVNGNNPAFTLAQVDPTTATLKDYTVYAADNQTGVATTWPVEYRYSTTYKLPDMSGESLAKLTSGFIADAGGTTPRSPRLPAHLLHRQRRHQRRHAGCRHATAVAQLRLRHGPPPASPASAPVPALPRPRRRRTNVPSSYAFARLRRHARRRPGRSPHRPRRRRPTYRRRDLPHRRHARKSRPQPPHSAERSKHSRRDRRLPQRRADSVPTATSSWSQRSRRAGIARASSANSASARWSSAKARTSAAANIGSAN